MKMYRIEFTGRTKGAIGITYPIIEWVEAESPSKAVLKLYDKHEHISPRVINGVGCYAAWLNDTLDDWRCDNGKG